MPPPKGTWNPIEGPGDYTTTKEVHNDTYPAIDPAKVDLSGKAIFISGASRGLGKAIAIAFAKARASYIAVGARSGLEDVEKAMKDAASEVGAKEPKILSLKLEVTDAQSVADAVQKIESEFGKLDVVISNAGILGKRYVIGESDIDQWWQTMNVNLRGPYLIARATLPLLLKSDLKTLINISSVGAHCVTPSGSDYQTSKLALLRLTEFIAQENAEKGIIAFSVHPGNMLTDMVKDSPAEIKHVFTETPTLCADSLVYLSKERREWLGGRYLNVTWDLPELLSPEVQKKIVDGDMLKVKLVTPSFE